MYYSFLQIYFILFYFLDSKLCCDKKGFGERDGRSRYGCNENSFTLPWRSN